MNEKKNIDKINGVRLLIFDFDGTIFQSSKAVYQSLLKAFSELGIKRIITEEDVKNQLGEPSEKFYKNLLGPAYAHLWQKVIESYDSMIPKLGSVFPGVAATLKVLKERGYTLALCSNCEVGYFNEAISCLGLKPYFDYAECKGQNNLTKTELVKKIAQEIFPNLKAAVIGDKIHDIEAARANGIPSIGALYGYGKDEPLKADMTIANFSELLDIFKQKF